MNTEIKKQMRLHDIKQWQLAEAIGVCERTLCVWLRHDLTGDRLQRVQAALDKLTGVQA